MAIEMALFHFASGDALLRLHGTEKNYDQAAIWFFDPSSPYFGWQSGGYGKAMIKRLFIEGPKQLLTTDTPGSLPAFAVLGLAWAALFSRERRFLVLGRGRSPCS